MSLSTVLFLFLANLGVGIAFTLLLVSRDAGIKFFRFNSGMAAIFLIVALAFQFREPSTRPMRPDQIAFIVAAAVLVLYWATVGRMFTSVRQGILAFAVAAGSMGIVMQALGAAAPGRESLTILTSFLSALLLGGACTSMVLGHWYLILPSMDVAHLQSIVKFHILSLLLRIGVVAAAVYLALTVWPPRAAGPSFRHYIFTSAGIFFWQRVLFGLAGPAVLSYLTWETAKIRSTQSATGILYVDFFTVVVGEVLAMYLLLATGVPV
jgi:hypothetical protein